MYNIESVLSTEADVTILDGTIEELEEYYNTDNSNVENEVEFYEGVQIISEPSPVTIAEGTFDGIYSRLEECILLLTILVFMTMLTFSKQIFATWRNNMKGRN